MAVERINLMLVQQVVSYYSTSLMAPSCLIQCGLIADAPHRSNTIAASVRAQLQGTESTLASVLEFGLIKQNA